MNHADFLVEVFKAEKSRQNYAILTIVKTDGSTPRRSGKMLVYANGDTFGTIGGGAIERMAVRNAIERIRLGAGDYMEYSLTGENEDAVKTGMTCGGDMTVLIEVFANKPQLVMCGAGHVGGALIKAAQFLGYEVTLVDDRPIAFIQDKVDLADRFVAVEDFRQGVLDLDVAPGAYFVIATYGHAHDGEALYAALQKDPFYVGMIGSKNKIAALNERLRAEGVPQDKLDNVYTPIGLDIGSETPEEIAISIVSELMQVTKGGTGKHLKEVDTKGKKK